MGTQLLRFKMSPSCLLRGMVLAYKHPTTCKLFEGFANSFLSRVLQGPRLKHERDECGTLWQLPGAETGPGWSYVCEIIFADQLKTVYCQWYYWNEIHTDSGRKRLWLFYGGIQNKITGLKLIFQHSAINTRHHGFAAWQQPETV